MSPVLRLLRPHQYAKNLLVFAAPGAAGRFGESDVVTQSVLAFVLFCAVSSAGYVTNDLLDVDADRAHPIKRKRPIANGDVSQRQALGLIAMLVALPLIIAVALGWTFVALLALYGATSASYSLGLKRVPWIELIMVSAGFVLRAVAGGAATNTPVSGWFLIVVSAGALLMITGKRIGEMVALGTKTASRSVLQGYTLGQLRGLLGVASTVAVAGYVTWAAAEATNRAADSTGSFLLRLSAVPFGLAIARYLQLAWRGAGETPEALMARDRGMLASGALWVAVYALGLYL